ncbi:MAG: (deoxy)nucleoside triphosphate pyrophosphohydrolase [Bacteroidales bacterium]|nr:(deoxy)nucleoside triphosphate pyrophosphohydrolase [Bacteroidales bacterium]
MIDVTCAIIRNEDDEILVVQRGEKTDHPFMWEFPGGKLNEDESEEDCIIREISEELTMNIVICGRLPAVEHDYGHNQIRLIPFVCDTLDDIPFLTEHVAFKWLAPGELLNIGFSEADIPVAEEYLEYINFEEDSAPEIRTAPAESVREADFVLMLENTHGRKEAEWLAEMAAEKEDILSRLINFSFSADNKLSSKASWSLSKIHDKHPVILARFIPVIIGSLDRLNNESVRRSFMKIISLSDITVVNRKQQGILADYCFRMLRSGFSSIAVKAYSMEIIYRLAQVYPELTGELAATINLLQDEKSAGIIAKGRIILKRLGGSS